MNQKIVRTWAAPGAFALGAAYEAHLRKADGSYVTVKLDKAFHVTGRDSGVGGPAQ